VRAIAIALLLLAAAPAALATRAPTASERAKIQFAVRFFPAISRSNRVSFTSVAVSSADPHYAAARFTVRDSTGKEIAAAAALLKRSGAWQVVEIGDAPLTCSSAPARVRADLAGTCAKR
jgi:hypothetical protein